MSAPPLSPPKPTFSPAQIKREVIACAQAVGFDSCRVTGCNAPQHASEFRDWLAAGAAGEMEWLSRGEEKRSDPQKILAGARSVIVVALNYWQGPERAESSSAPSGRIARYAWGDDYHELMLRKMEQLAVILHRHGGGQKCYVDTGPLLERDHAAEAGVGWHGKSTMLIDRKLGTWFLLGEILTTLELPRDDLQPARCGSCSRCIKACPTGAITSPHHLDARRCISYLTIESKGAIPIELRPLIGDRIYGCDDCLDACPWNKFAAVSRESAFMARAGTEQMVLRDYLLLDDDQFRALFRGSPIKRVKRRGFLRNVCVALGNVGGPSDLPALEKARADCEPLISEHAAWAIDQISARSRRPMVERSALFAVQKA
ncbi:MAG: tRNA epoxyqueuosine(34) reductase QueG [Chthoniobacterales bacterium]